MKSIFTKSTQTDRTIRAISEKHLNTATATATATAAPSEGKQTTAVTASAAAAGLASFVSNERQQQ